MSIAKKLILLIATGLTALLFVTTFSWFTAHSNEAAYQEMFRTDYHQVELSQGALNHLGLAVQSFKDYLMRKDTKYIEEFKQHVAAIENSLKEYATISDPNEVKLATETQALLPTYRKSIDALVQARAASDDIASVDLTLAKGVDKPMRKALELLAETSRLNIDKARQEILKQTDVRLYIEIAATAVAGLFLLIFGTILGRGIRSRISHFSGIIDRVADNDLTVRADVSSNDEIGYMGTRLNAMLHSLCEIVRTMNDTASQVSAASSQLSSTSVQIATGAEEVSAQAQTVGTASEQMAATSADIAHNCVLVADSAGLANTSARDGAAVVETTIIGMTRIAERVAESARTVEGLGRRSDQIGAIVETIEDIADQTNLLALNAAIEAARAGEQGRGFAVVADEVRALAERTTKATREIGDMIKAIQSETRGAVAIMEEGVREVEQGNEDATRSATALQEILVKIGDVARDVNQIATAAEEQTATTHEISNNILQMSQVVEDTARGSQESAHAASDLSRLAEELQCVVSRFRFA
ncbi:MAG: hypothetical protein A2076_01540 [Geobacteraceae bacterium GWC2_53_11]|nr:MAG: hypothetical protein A2076_01540 [Geobacteraceae bacterium GWC2_53_11]